MLVEVRETENDVEVFSYLLTARFSRDMLLSVHRHVDRISLSAIS